MKNFRIVYSVLACMVVLSFALPVFALETRITQEAKQQALDSLAIYEREMIAKLVFQGEYDIKNSAQCAGEDCLRIAQRQRADESNPIYREAMRPKFILTESNQIAHRFNLYFLNDGMFQHNYNNRTEHSFSLTGQELDKFKKNILQHYLANNSEKLKAELLLTRPEYIIIRVYVTQQDLKALTESETRMTQIRHSGHSKIAELKH